LGLGLFCAQAVGAEPETSGLALPEAFQPTPPEAVPEIIDAMTSRADRALSRAMKAFAETDEPPYFMALQLYDTTRYKTVGVDGYANAIEPARSVSADIDVRVGTPELDNTHERNRWGGGGTSSAYLPENGASLATEVSLWMGIDNAYRGAAKQYEAVLGEAQIEVEREDPSPDFSPAPVVDDLEQVTVFEFDAVNWRERVAQQSARFLDHPELVNTAVTVEFVQQVRTFVSTEGARVRNVRRSAQWRIGAELIVEDGMRLSLSDSEVVASPSDLPNQEAMVARLDALVERLEALGKAPIGEPQAAPAILGGRAAAVFFHEVFGHRSEGHRQKDEDEGQTFTKKVGTQILPKFLSVVDDPTIEHLEGVGLNGHYAYDDEGVAAERVVLVEDGTLRGFLLSRSPILGFGHSNGHGRRAPGYSVVARQGNLMVQAESTRSDAELRKLLIDEVRSKELEYGYLIEEIAGGFTFTGRVNPNAFNVRPLSVWRIYEDGRPDELIRGIDFIGTPLVSFSRIIAAGETTEVFNGFCGAESGYVPVSASSPALLLSEVEVQRKEKSKQLPPILPAPTSKDGLLQ